MAASSSCTAASTSTSAVGNPNNKIFHVFLNHRGVDVKKTLGRSLYLRLLENGLTAFLDNEEIKAGYEISSQLEHAVRIASVHVAIFSPRYAESHWCLDELLLMLETKAPIIPVFYHVTPSHVRWALGQYDQDLKTHEEKGRHNSNTITRWRKALNAVANYSGFQMEMCNGEELELELVNKVVKSVLAIVKKPDLYVAQHPTGLDDKVKDFEDRIQLQQQQSGKPQILGIVGLGGVGKTTLTKQFFNKKKSYYERSCFLSDVRDKAAKGSLNSLQKKLLKDLEQVEKPIDTIDEGKSMLIEPLKCFKALVILDDVDDVDQVEALLPVQADNLHSGSLILISSRDNRVLIGSKLVEISSIYRLTGLDYQYSRELLCNHAFSQPCPLPGFESLVDGFLQTCKGLPLSLKVFGALLYGRDISDWEDELESLQQILPEKIHGTFMKSYNSLNKEEKYIFLDIACFFIGVNRDTAIGIWNRSGWRGRRGFQNLQNKCLVEVDERNSISMHDHIRDLRIDVAEDSSPRRLWRRTSNVTGILLSSEKTVRALQMVCGEYNCHGKDDVFGVNDTENALLKSHFRRLQILNTENARLERILKTVELPNLIWLLWENFPYSSLPSWVPLNNLSVLRVSRSRIKTLWHRKGESEGSHLLPICLEELWAQECVRLKSITELAQLTKLRILNVSGCSQLEELPSIEILLSLEDLCTSRCVKLKSLRGLAPLTKLRLLHVDGCSQLEELPSIETMLSLEEFRAAGCVKLKSIRGSAPLTKLRLFYVNRCSELEELPNMDGAVSLEELQAVGCVKLRSIRGSQSLTKLRLLFVNGCSELEELPSMDGAASLVHLNAKGCVKLKSIPGSTPLTKLRLLCVNGCSKLEELLSMDGAISLEELGAIGCVKLKSILGSGQLTKLGLLYVNGCSELEDLPCMDGAVSLERLNAEGCVTLKRIRGSTPLTKLRLLHVNGCSELEELPSMDGALSLEELRAIGCVKLKRILGSGPLTKLGFLHINGCSELEDLPCMDGAVSLEHLNAQGCVKLKRILGSTPLTNLRLFCVNGCSELEELPSMDGALSLEELQAVGCVKLQSIQGSAPLAKLRLFYVGGCSELKELPNMDGAESLEHLNAKGCVMLKSIKGSTPLTKLRLLCVNGCLELEELPSMDGALDFPELLTAGCVKLKHIRGSASFDSNL